MGRHQQAVFSALKNLSMPGELSAGDSLYAKKLEINLSDSQVDLKGLGHAILGNFSTDQIVMELT